VGTSSIPTSFVEDKDNRKTGILAGSQKVDDRINKYDHCLSA
jgi:hypothetical protein